MKVEMIFLTAVLGIAGLHMLFSLINFLTRHKRANVQESRQERMADDWYVFFKKSALYGDMADTAVEPKVARENSVECKDIYQPQESYS